MINKLGFSQSHVVVIDQSDACLQSLPSYLWVSKPRGNQSFKNTKTCPKIYPWGNSTRDLPLVSKLHIAAEYLCWCVFVRKMMAELFPSLEQELTNFEVFGIQIDTTYVSCMWYKALRCFSYIILQYVYQLSGLNACPPFLITVSIIYWWWAQQLAGAHPSGLRHSSSWSMA